MEFTELNLHPDLAKGIAEAGYVTCTPVQAQVLSNAFGGQDLYVQSQTGTGKTAAFLIVVFQRLLTEALLGGKKALIMTPTRELAVQIEEEAKLLGKYLPFKIGSFFGGVGYAPQQQLLRDNVQVLVGTPGRVLDLNESGQMNLMDIAFLVIDEADRMFDMGFYPDLRKLIRVVPPADRRQTMLFSATLNAYVKNLAWEYTKTPFEIEIAPEVVTLDEVDELLYHVPSEDKMRLLLGIFEREQPESAIVFCNTKRYTEIVAKRLRLNGYECEFIIGDLPQVKRLKVIEDVKAGNIRYLVATDVAARGLDIEGLALVVNYDLPNEAENYVHRIGRTARAGKTGRAITLATEQDVYELPAIERYLGKKIPSETATEELFAADKSEGVRIQTEFYEDRDDRRGDRGGGGYRDDGRGRSFGGDRRRERYDAERERGGRERRGSGRGRGDDRRRGRPRERDDYGEAREERRETRRPPRPESLSRLSPEERVAYYKEKYGEGFGGEPSPARERPASEPRRDRGGRRDGRWEDGERRGGPDNGQQERSGRRRRRGRRGGRGGRGRPQDAARQSSGRQEKAKSAPAKKGLFSKVLGLFKGKK
jgi:ATP-dependent RNA helicase RhlB